MLTSSEIRKKYLEFFQKQGHVIIPSASLLPENDPTTLFTSSGMQPLVPYLTGEKHPAGTRLVNAQKSFRAEDIEEVGDNRHTTFFEMLGNWSLGDYFKSEQLPWIFEFLTAEIRLDPARLYVSVFRGNDEIGIKKDAEAIALWKDLFRKAGIEARDLDYPTIEAAEKIGMQDARIFAYPEKKNWWSRSGVPAKMPVGEIGGPDSEIFIDLGANLKRHENSAWRDLQCHINCDCGRFIELGNSVFMQFVRTENDFAELPQKNVDFGGGLERVVMAVQGKDNIFETDLFINIIGKIENLSGKKYRDDMRSFEVIADHMRAATFIIGDDKGVGPSNTGQGYLVRRLLRRAIRFGHHLGIAAQSWLGEIAQIIIEDYSEVYDELIRNKDFILKQIREEEEKFIKTVEQGVKELIKLNLGFQINPFVDEKKEGVIVDGNNENFGAKLFYIFSTYGLPFEMSIEEIEHNHRQLYDKNFKLSEDLILKYKNEFDSEIKKHQELSRTASAGMFKGGLADSSVETTRLHTAAHLLLASLRKVLGDHVVQRGSNITAERLRFDFSHPEKMTPEQITAVESLVNEAIGKQMPVSMQEMTVEEAKNMGAMGVFESKYGEKVKVYTIEKDGEIASKEICGGPHVKNTGELGKFEIQKEESSSAGVRRIKAILG